MVDITSVRLIYLKGLLFLLAGLLAAGTLVSLHRDWQTVFLLVVSIWCFARVYYFAFYVIERYVDREYRFSGLGSFAVYLWSRVRRSRGPG